MGLYAARGATKLNISELAAAAGMARGTVYSHVPDVDGLFEEVAAELSTEMIRRVVACLAETTDPAARLAIGVRQYIRRAHEEPLWGRFMCRFGLADALMKALLAADPTADLQAGIESGRYVLRREQLAAAVSMLAGGTLAAMLPVLDGRGTWRDVGSDTVELMLVALGIERAEARALATQALPPLPPLH